MFFSLLPIHMYTRDNMYTRAQSLITVFVEKHRLTKTNGTMEFFNDELKCEGPLFCCGIAGIEGHLSAVT